MNTQGTQWDCRCIPVNAQGDQRNCTVSGDESGVQRDCVDICVCVSEWQASTGLAAGSCNSQHTCCTHWMVPRTHIRYL